MIGLVRLAFDWRRRRIIASRGRVRTRDDSTASYMPKCTVREDARARHTLGSAPRSDICRAVDQDRHIPRQRLILRHTRKGGMIQGSRGEQKRGVFR